MAYALQGLTLIDGYAHQNITTGNGGMYDTAQNPSFSTGVLRTPRHQATYFCNQNNAANSLRYNFGTYIGANPSVVTMSLYFMVPSGGKPTGATSANMMFATSQTNGGSCGISMGGSTNGGMLIPTIPSGSGTATSKRYDDGLWHRVDMCFDATNNPWVISWQIDGITQTPCTSALAADTFNSVGVGASSTAIVFPRYYSDIFISNSAADYPIGPHEILPLHPSGEGTDHLGTTNPIKGDGNETTNLYQKLQAWKAGATPGQSAYIQYTNTTLGDGSSNYVEVLFDDPVATSAIMAVRSYRAMWANSSTSCNCAVKVVDSSGNNIEASAVVATSSTALVYNQAANGLGIASTRHMVTPPSGGWTPANLADVRMRWGFTTDTNPIIKCSGLMLEYACLPPDQLVA